MSRTAKLHLKLQANDLLVADRAFCSYAHFALLQRGVHGLLQMHQITIVDFTPGRARMWILAKVV